MHSPSAIRLQVESALARRIPSALTPRPRTVRPVEPTGIEPLDSLLHGGLPVGAITELTGPECSGRTSVALSFIARLTQAEKVCAWIDVSNALDPTSAAAAGVPLGSLLWVRCGVQPSQPVSYGRRFVLPQQYLAPPPIKRGLHGGGFGPHPRTESKGLSQAIGDLFALRAAEPQHPTPPKQSAGDPTPAHAPQPVLPRRRARQYDAMEQGLRSADLLLQTGGFSAIVLDLAGMLPEFVARIELASWHRYRLAAERSQTSILLLTQHPCARSCSELQLKLLPPEEIVADPTVFTGVRPHVELVRQRFTQAEPSNVVPLRKPPQSTHTAHWENRTTWAVCR